MAEMNQAQREEELARREALLAQREAQLEKEQAELAAAKAQSAEKKKDSAGQQRPEFRQPQGKALRQIPLTVHQMDIIIGVLFALILLFLVLGMTHTSFFRAVRRLNPARPTRAGTNKRTKAPAGAGAFCLLQMPVTAGRISG